MARRQSTITSREALFRDAVAIIERDYAHPLDLNRLGAEIAASRRQLQRVFSEVGGTSFRSYLARIRMRRALELLREGKMPVRQVARRVGYRQPAQFAKTFRRYHGAPPSSFMPTNGQARTRLRVVRAET